jgi:hypothetical protein
MHTLPCIFLKVYYSIVPRNPHIYELYLLVPDINITVPASEDYICARNYRPCFRENRPKRSFSIK